MVEAVGSLLVTGDNYCRSLDIGSSVDGSGQTALKGKIQIRGQLPKYFGGEVS
jgi:hypothetical protein